MKLATKTKGKGAPKTDAVLETQSGPKQFLPLEHIVDHPDVGNRELDKEWVGELAESIRANGLDTPLFVWNGGEDYANMQIGNKELPSSFLIAGMHRRAALKVIRKTDAVRFAELFPAGIPVRFFGGDMKDVLFLQLRENVNRLNPTVEQLLPKVIRLRDEFKLRSKVIASHIGRSEAYVSQLLAVEAELGTEGVAEIISGNVDAKDALKAVQALKADKKAGKTPDKKGAIEKAKASTAKRRDAGRDRDEKRTSFKVLWKRYQALPDMKDEEKLKILEKACGYIAGERDAVPRELKVDREEESETEEG